MDNKHECVMTEIASINSDNINELNSAEQCSSQHDVNGEEQGSPGLQHKLLEFEGETESLKANSNSRSDSFSSHSDFEVSFHHLFDDLSRRSSPLIGRDTPGSSSSSSEVATASLMNGIDILLQRLSSERLTELRRIQLGERPVTGTNARENLENFFHRSIHGPTVSERISEGEQNRPTIVTNDVQNLLQQRVVNSTLQNSFRQQLERTLSRRASPANTTRQPRQPRINTPTRNQPVDERTQFRSRLEDLFRSRISTSNVSSPSRTRNARPTLSSINSTRRDLPNSVPNNTLNRSAQQQTVNNNSRRMEAGETDRLQITIESGMEILTRTISDDLNRLQSLQVVSNMLDSNFRDHLEDMVQQRVSDIGITETPDVRTEILRNRATRQSEGNETPELMSSEIRSLKRQLDEMKRMLSMSLEIQMDTQRSIKQEVSAVFAGFMQQMMATQNSATHPATQPALFQPPQNTPASVGQCVICVERNIDSVFYQCGHMCACHYCGLQLKLNGDHCPMCRAPIRDVIRAYQSQNF